MFTLKRAEFYVVLVFLFLMMIASVSAQEFAGGSGTEADPWQIETHVHLNNVRNYLGSDHSDKHFIQTADIDLYDATREGGVYWNDGEGWEPIGYWVDTDDPDIIPFSGFYDGHNYAITTLFIHRPDEAGIGLFGYSFESIIQNVTIDVQIAGNDRTGGLIGYATNSLIQNTNITGTSSICGSGGSGGLIGWCSDSIIINCSVSGVVNGSASVGGLIGASLGNSLVSGSNCNIDVTGLYAVGGLIGANRAIIENCYSSGVVSQTGTLYGGGLVGHNGYGAIIDKSFSNVSITGTARVGGLVGKNYQSTISNSHSNGTVWGNNMVGGLLGRNAQGSIINCFYAGNVAGNSNIGGLVGGIDTTGNYQDTNNYWNTETSGQTSSLMGNGRTTTEMTYPYAVNTYVDWDFEEIWMPDVTYIINEGYPFLIDTISITEIPNHATNHNPIDGENSVLPHASLSWEVDFDDSLLNLPIGFRISLGTDYPPTNLINDLDIGYTYYFTPEMPFLVNEIHYWQVVPYNNVGDALDCPIWSFTTDSFAGGSGTEADPWQIETHVHLNNVRNYLGSDHSDKHFIQIADIDLYDATREGGAYWNNGEGWDPIGWHASQGSSHFYGNYDGTSHIIDYLYINRADDHYQELFSVIDEATISNLGITNTDITAYRIIGSLTSFAVNSSIFNCFSSGICTGIHATDTKVGGLIGATGQHSTISNCYSNSEVSGPSRIGGLVGQNQSNSTIIHSISSGIVSGSGSGFGGLVGNNSSNAIVSNSFSSSSVIGYSRVGGLVGFNYEDAIVVNSYSTGSVVGTGYVGGLIGGPGGTVINSYWDIETSGQTTSPMGQGRTTAEMTYPYATNTYVDWDFDDIWAEVVGK